MEPYKLRQWGHALSGVQLDFWTCARPGRSKGKKGKVPDKDVLKWLEGLPKGEKTVIISLLGTKPNGVSEFSFYTMTSSVSAISEAKSSLTFSEWIASKVIDRIIEVLEYPTEDFKQIPIEILEAIHTEVYQRIKNGFTVILVDSGGETRTGQECRHLGFVNDSRR